VKLLKMDASGSRPFVIEGNESRFLAPVSLGLDEAILSNLTTATYVDTDITISDLIFDGNNLTVGSKRTSTLVRIQRVVGIALENVRVTNTQYIGMALTGSREVHVTACQFDNCGWQTSSSNGGSALFITETSGGGTDGPQDIMIVGCQFNDNNWHGMHLSAERATVTGCTFHTNKEAHIFVSDSVDAPCRDISIVGNVFDGVTVQDIASPAIEFGSVQRFSVTGNTIQNTDRDAIALTKSSYGVISGNTIGNCGVTGGDESFCITIAANGTDAGSDRSKNISITGNVFFDDNGTSITEGGVQIFGSGDDLQDVTIVGNTFDSNLIGTNDVIHSIGRWDTSNGCHVGFNPGFSTPITLAFTGTNLINIPMNLESQVIRFTGTSGSISNMTNGAEGQKITMFWNAGADFGIIDTAGGAGEFNLAGGSNIAVGTHGEGDSIEVVNIGGDWYQTSVSNN